MLKSVDYFSIPIKVANKSISLYINPQTEKSKMFEDDNPSDVSLRYQLMEGGCYNYEFVSEDGETYQFNEENELISFHKSPRHPSEGVITTGIYVGHLSIHVIKKGDTDSVGNVHFEIRSVKTDYESDYRQMLEEIAEYYTDLVLQQGAPVTQRLEIDPNLSANTLYQRFAFIQSIIESTEFGEAIHKIVSNPIRKWENASVKQNIVNVKRLSRNILKQIASAGNRMALSSNSCPGLPDYMTSVPRYLDVEYKQDTVDNAENQFVKFALRSFYLFCSDLKDMRNASSRLKFDAEQTIKKISEFLDCQFFRKVSSPSFFNMNSPALQRKEGYREVFQSWLLFDLSAKLNWTGGDDVYEAGKKNVATLYEYWLFFKLLELVCDTFGVEPRNKSELVNKGKDEVLNLDLKQGRMKMVYGRNASSSRILNVALYYNRTFKKIVDNETEPYFNKAGSWTMSMRPDYTLSLWPGEISEESAEEQDVITHIHFDAKYRLDRIPFENGSGTDNSISEKLNSEKTEQEMGVYKRADLLKMHAYKDAIRRTSGAYVLYPGTEGRIIKGFHEIVPGLGAFSVRPGYWREDSYALKTFLLKVKEHLLDRISQREKMSYYQYETYRNNPGPAFKKAIPENVRDNRGFIPDETMVLVADVKNLSVFKWMCERHLFAVCLGYDADMMSIDQYIKARYILLHDDNEIYGLIRIQIGSDDKRIAPYICSRTELIKKGWPHNTNDKGFEKVYLVFTIDPNMSCEKEMKSYRWNLNDILPNIYMKEQVFSLNLIDLINKAI